MAKRMGKTWKGGGRLARLATSATVLASTRHPVPQRRTAARNHVSNANLCKRVGQSALAGPRRCGVSAQVSRVRGRCKHVSPCKPHQTGLAERRHAGSPEEAAAREWPMETC